MELLKSMKRIEPVGNNLSFILLCILQIQILALLMAKKNTVFFGQFVTFTNGNLNLTIMAIFIFTSYLIQGGFMLWSLISSRSKQNIKNKELPKSLVLGFIQYKPYILFVILSEVSVSGIKSDSTLLKYISFINLSLLIIQLMLIQVVNISFRFIERNKLRRKNNSIVPFYLIICMFLSLIYYDSLLYGAIFLITRAFTVGYNNFYSLQNDQLRKSQWIFPLIELQMGILVIIEQFSDFRFFNNITIFSVIIFFTIYSSNSLSEHLFLTVPKYHMYQSRLLLKDESEDEEDQKSQEHRILSQEQLSAYYLQLYILVEIYMMRKNYNKGGTVSSSKKQDYDEFWKLLNQLIFNHKFNCSNVQCRCNIIQPRSKNNWEIENQIIVMAINDLIEKLKYHSVNSTKSHIIENYFLIQLENKPLKSYFQIIKLLNSQNSFETFQELEIDNPLQETRSIFRQLLLKQKVQNNDLDVESLFQFQDHLKNMRNRLNEMTLQYKRFYEIFANNFVQMENLKKETKKLTDSKDIFRPQIDQCLQKYNKSQGLMAFCIVYFKFFDEYTNKLQKVQERSAFLIQVFKNPFIQVQKRKIDIFDPHYGAVKADLVFNAGKIITITKNMCNLLGYPYKQLVNQKVDKMMPTIFSRSHGKFLKNFVEKGKIKIMKHKQLPVYAKNNKNFILPMNLRLKMDYSSTEGLYSVAFLDITETKSQFILLNNYGKVQEITDGIYQKIFGKALGSENRKVKRLCAGKFLLSLNYILKNFQKTKGLIHEGIIMTSQMEDVLMEYYKFPEFKKILKAKQQIGQSTGRSILSTGSEDFSTNDQSKTIDLSEDLSKFNVDLKESIRAYLKALDLMKVTGYRVSFRCQDFVTTEFKFKVLEILSVKQELHGSYLKDILKQQIIDVAEVMGFEHHEIIQFKTIKQIQTNQKFQMSFHDMKPEMDQKNSYQRKNSNDFDENNEKIPQNGLLGSQTGSMLSLSQKEKKKQTLINAFLQKPTINQRLQIALTVSIFFLACLLTVVCFFSLRLQASYTALQHDNLLVSSYRMSFLQLLGLQQLSLMYDYFNITRPDYIQANKKLYRQNMRNQLIQSTSWIGISSELYQTKLQLKYADINFEQENTFLSAMSKIYSTFAGDSQHGKHITENYIEISDALLRTTTQQEILIMNDSKSNKDEINFIIIFYSIVLVAAIFLGFWYRKIAVEKQSKIIDTLPFFKPKDAKRNQLFFQKFYDYNRQSQQLDNQKVQGISNYFNQENDNNSKDLKKITQQQKNSRLLIKIIKNQKSGITLKSLILGLFVLALCLLVVVYSEYYFNSADSKFLAYLKLKTSAFLVQLIPSRMIALYFSNINRMLQNETLFNYPERFYNITHDRIFQLQFELTKPQFYGTQMEKIVSDHFSRQICSMVQCSDYVQGLSFVRDQQAYYLSYSFVNAFKYLRDIIMMLPETGNPKQEIKKWMDENQILSLIFAQQQMLALMNRSQKIITDLFTQQIIEIGNLLLAFSCTLIPIIIIVLLLCRKKYIQFIVERLFSTEQIFRHLCWSMLSQNNYAVNHFETKTKNSLKK